MKIAIDLGGTNVRVGVVKGGEVTGKLTRPCPSDLSCEDSVQYLIQLIETMMDAGIQGIGIGVPSLVDAARGIVYNVTNIPSWKEVHLKSILEDKFGIPVCVNNDANCFALGEKMFGEGKPYNNMLGITIGTGVGSGVIINGQLYNGRNTGAGEIGELPYLEHNFEYYCGSNFFTCFHGTTGRDAAIRAGQDDPLAVAMWNEFGQHFGNLMKAVLFAYDPEAIVLGGGIADAYHFFEKKMWESIHTFPYTESVNNLRILVTRNENISLLGASALIS